MENEDTDKVDTLRSMKASLRSMERIDFILWKLEMGQASPDMIHEARTLMLGVTCRMDADITNVEELL